MRCFTSWAERNIVEAAGEAGCPGVMLAQEAVTGAVSFGLGPYMFGPGWLSVTKKRRITKAPISGMRTISHHQPLCPVSWRRRTSTPREGRRTAIL